MAERLTYTVTEAARLLGVSRNTAYEAVRRGDIRAVNLGRRVLVPRDALDAFLAGDHVDSDRQGEEGRNG